MMRFAPNPGHSLTDELRSGTVHLCMSSVKLASIILAAGQGTRMKSDRAKVLLELSGEPLVSYPVRLARALGADPVVLVVGHQRDAVKQKVAGVTFADQVEQKGTGHAV